MSKLPKERTSVVTILRNPIDRVFSTYEFSVEVAARFLVHPNLTSAIQMSNKVRSGNIGVSTLDMWPWKHLVPLMRERTFFPGVQLILQRNGRNHGDFWEIKETNNPYDMKDFVMPFEEFINSSVAYNILHNGATYQIAGLTDNSYLEDREVRTCAMSYQSLGKFVLKVAKKSRQYVISLHELPAIKQKRHSKIAKGFRTKERKASEVPSSDNAQKTNETMTVEELMEAYDGCSSSLRNTQARRPLHLTKSLHKISQKRHGFRTWFKWRFQEMISSRRIRISMPNTSLCSKKGPLVQKSLKMNMQEDDGFEEAHYGELFFIVKDILFAITVFFSVVLSMLL
ncbi:hypothetical protein MKW98_026616, partial [Papaver atlanticum]